MLLNPLMLAGLGGAVVPLVLHLLARARHRDVQWGAMMFLDGADVRPSQSARLRQWALLGLRMGTVALLAVALARPVLRSSWTLVGAEGRVTAVILLDCSYSMGLEEAGRSRFEKARDAALQVLAALRKGDEVALVLLGEQVDARPATSNLQKVARDLSDLQVSAGSADIARGLDAAKQILTQPGRLNRELYVITDRQALSWKGFDAATDVRWISDRNAPTRFYVIPVGGEETDNVSVESVELVESVAVRGQPAEVEVRLQNYSPAQRASFDLTLSMMRPSDGPRRASDPGHRIKSVPVSIAARSAASVRIPVVFDRVGSHVLTAQINAPGLSADNRLDTAIDVIDPIEVLIASGDERASSTRGESFFLRLALAPYQTAQKRPADACIVTVRGPDDWFSGSLDKYRVIILANLPQVTADQARFLEQRIYEGCGVIIAPGNMARVENYNSHLYRDGMGLLPAKLESPTAADGSGATTLLGLELRHPVFHFLRGSDPLPEAVIGRYFPAVARADAKVLATYASGRPFLVDGPRGRGRALLVTTALDADWGRLPLDPFFLPFMQSMVRYACASSLPSRNLAAHETLMADFQEPLGSVEMFRGDEKLAMPPVAGKTQVIFADTQRGGIYRVRARFRDASRPERVLHFVVQSPRAESDLSVLSGQQWRDYQRMLGFARIEGSRSVAPVVAADRGGRELWLPLIAGVVLLGAAELGLARLWGREAG